MTTQQSELTQDDFLGGDLKLLQPVSGYRAGVDPVFLAAAVSAQPGDTILDIGCGVGAAGLCLASRINGIRLVGLERQAAYAELARKNASTNEISMDVYQCDLTEMPKELRQEGFDHVIMNPPYYLRERGSASPNTIREEALGEETPLINWIDQATRRLKPRGYLTIIQQAERLPSVLSSMDDRLGSVLVKPLCPRIGRAATLVLVQARKGGRGAFRLAAPLILHQGESHEGDREHYTPEVSAILRNGHALPMW